MVLLILLLSVTAAIMVALAVRSFGMAASDRALAVAGAHHSGAEAEPESELMQLDARFRKTKPGRWLAEELELAEAAVSPLVAVLILVTGMSILVWVIYRFLSPILAIVGVILALFAGKVYLEHGQRRRTEKFVGQLPELARVIANASNAGLSLNTAIGMAAHEMTAPASVELERVATRIKFGSSLESALDGLRKRIPSREVGILVSTLIISGRSGGSTVTALRTIAEALEQRKQTRREIESTLAQSTATANMIAFMGLGVLFLLNLLYPGSVDKMTRSLVGQVALGFSGSLLALGIFVIRRMTRIE